MAEYAIDEEDTELVQAISVNLGSLKRQFETAFYIPQPKEETAKR